jgi:glutamine synthetase
LVALTAPSVNSFHRLTAGAWASSTNAWGFDNREAAIRVASPFHGREAQTYNIEYKPMDAAANPYLAFGAVLRAGLDGITRGLPLAPPALVDPAKLSRDERAAAGVLDLPANLGEALEELATDDVLVDALGPLLHRAFLAVRRSEIAVFAEQSVEQELAAHLYKY